MKKLFYFLSLVSLANINNHISGMESLSCIEQQSPKKFYFDSLPENFKRGFIEKLAACSDEKYKLMQLNTLFYTLCSRKNADKILLHTPLRLNSSNQKYFMHKYVSEGNFKIVELLLTCSNK